MADLFTYADSDSFTPPEKAALRYAEIFKADKEDTDWDRVYADPQHRELGRGVRAEADAEGGRARVAVRDPW